MPLGPPDRNPPPFFRQGASAQARLVLCAALALFLMVADARFHVVEPARAALALVLHPFQRLLLSPVDAWESFGDYRRGTERAICVVGRCSESSRTGSTFRFLRSVRLACEPLATQFFSRHSHLFHKFLDIQELHHGSKRRSFRRRSPRTHG